MNLDYGLKDATDRLAAVRQICEDSEREVTKARMRGDDSVRGLDATQLKYLGDYLLFVGDAKQTIREKSMEHPIVTKNREVTVSKRQGSFEEMADNMRGGADALHMLILPHNDYPLDTKDEITEEDMERIPGLKANMEVIDSLKRQFSKATGRRRYELKSQMISKWQEMYTMKASFEGKLSRSHIRSQIYAMGRTEIPERITVGEDGNPTTDAWLSLLVPEHVRFLLRYYQPLKQDTWEELDSDMRWMLIDLEDLVYRTLMPEHEMLYDLVVWKIDGLSGPEIVQSMERDYGESHSEQYWSTLWSKTIPNMVSQKAKQDWLVYHYLREEPEKGHWKLCRKCGKAKLAHPYFFNRNSSIDGYYSVCKECRAKKRKLVMGSGRE